MPQNKDEQTTEEHSKKKAQEPIITPESVAEQARKEVLGLCLGNAAMPDVRRHINESITKAGIHFTSDERKELSQLLRTKFERMRQFMEAAHQEIISLTSQVGW